MDYSPHSINKWWILLAIGLGTFMTALDTSATNAILPKVRESLKIDIATILLMERSNWELGYLFRLITAL